jgi:hypothetical protein
MDEREFAMIQSLLIAVENLTVQMEESNRLKKIELGVE